MGRFILNRKKNFILIGLIFVWVLFNSCGSGAGDEETYTITFENLWKSSNKSTHFPDFPAGGTVGHFFVVNHNSDYKLWEKGGIATSGFRVFVEDDTSDNLKTELDLAKEDETVLSYKYDETTDILEFQITLKKDYPLLSFAVNLEPSPDWFAGLDSLIMFQNESWVATHTEYLSPYDAGTKEGTTFLNGGDNEYPQKAITDSTADGFKDTAGDFKLIKITAVRD